MFFHRSALCALALFVGLPVAGGATAAAGGRLIFGINSHESTTRVDVLASGKDNVQVKYGQCWVFAGTLSAMRPDGDAATATATVESDAGEEKVTLEESDAWLHGAATIKALPKTDATLSLTLYDKTSASLMSFSGTLGTDGAVTLTADDTKDSGTGCATKTGCTDTTESAATSVDVEVLAAEVFGAAGAYELGIDLAGADTYEVAYAELTVTESTEETTCDKVKGCSTTGTTTTTKAEVGWDDVGAVWTGDLTEAPEGLVEMKVKAYDIDGEKLDSTKAKLGVPWLDAGEGVTTVATDDDPLTSLAFVQSANKRAYGAGKYAMDLLTIVSEGWSASDTLPVEAELELTNGETITIPVNSYQRRVKPEFYAEDIRFTYGSGTRFRLAVNGSSFDALDTSVEGYEPGEVVCDDGTCVTLAEGAEGGIGVSVTVYGASAAKLADEAELVLTELDEAGAELESVTFPIEFDEQITAAFASEVSFSEDPIGLDLSGKVSLLAQANKKGKQETLAKGKFYAGFTRDGDGDLSLGGADKDAVESSGDIVVAGEAVGLVDKEGTPAAPPAIQYSNGSGTKNATTTTSTRPQLL